MNLKYFIFTIIATLSIGIFFTSTDFITAPYLSIKDIFVLSTQWAAICTVLWFLINVISINKYIFATLFPVIVFFSSILAYFRYTSNTILTSMILDSAFDNDVQISLELITKELVFFVLISLLFSVALAIYRFKKVQVKRPLILFVTMLSLFFVGLNIPQIKRPLAVRIPFNLYFVPKQYFLEKKEIQKERPSLSTGITCDEKDEDLTVLFVLGESLRADHLSFNGYHRNTTPLLNNEDIISFPNIHSEYCHTNRSIPHILTRADSINPDFAFEERSFIDLFKHCGFYSSWLANQEPGNTYAYFMNEADTLLHVNINKSSYVFDKWTDADLLPLLDNILQKDKRRQLIILHTIGSHWYYNSHYTDEFQKFNPITKSRIVSSCTKEEMINSYDNTVCYTDFFLYSVINRLRDKNAILIYLSDHGEALGEDGVWLHAITAPSIQNPACFVWMSPEHKSKNLDKYEALKENQQKRYHTDFLFHTITLAAGIRGDIIKEEMSLFN